MLDKIDGGTILSKLRTKDLLVTEVLTEAGARAVWPVNFYAAMRRTISSIVVFICLSICFPASLWKTNAARHDPSVDNASTRTALPVTEDLNDSDEFFQRAVSSSGQTRDYSKQIEALLRQMTIEEKAGEMTQSQLAEAIGMTRQTVAAIEAGKYSPSLEAAFRIAHVFGAEIGEVFQWIA